MQFIRRDEAIISSDIEELAEEVDQMETSHQQTRKNNNSPQHQR